MTQIGAATGLPMVHTIQLLDWSTGGEMPDELKGRFEDLPEDGAQSDEPETEPEKTLVDAAE